MVSSSSSYPQINAFSGIEPAGERRVVSESSKLYDVFINHRGPDVKQTLAIQLYNSLNQLGIRAFLDSEEKELGNSFPSILETAIRSASAHIAIFSKGYAQSPWCLAELVLMLQTQAKIIPVFYEVKPWELRHVEKGVYKDAFIEYEEKGRYLDKLDGWKEALQSLSFIAEEEFNSFSDCKSIVAAVQKEVQRKKKLHVAKYPVGLDSLVEDFESQCFNELVQDFENQCMLQQRRDKAKANVVGIYGMGGVGKTTLAKELFNRKSSDYSKSSILFDVREASVRSELPSLQVKLLKDLFGQDHCNFTSTEEGTSNLIDCFQRDHLKKFLIVVDDIDHVEQLDALVVMDILDRFDNILVIFSTRDVGVLIAAGITVGYHLKGMDRNVGRQLFCWHAFDQPHPCSGYEELVEGFVDVCGGLPLSLQVLGRHVHARDHSYWKSELIKVSKTLPRDVMKRLKISFDALDGEEKQVFMDIACFFVGEGKSIADRVWEGSGWSARHALETLQDKCLISLEGWGELEFRMHDHLRDLGREMALELGPPHRLWRPQDLDLTGFKDILAKANVRCFHSIIDNSMDCRVTFFLGQSDISVGTSSSLLWLKLDGYSLANKQRSSPWSPSHHRVKEQLSIPSWIPLQSLQCLHMVGCGQFKPLWKNPIQAPSHLKELIIYYSSLEELNLTGARTLSCLDITNCKKLKGLKGTSDLTNLVLLNICLCPKLEFEYLCLRGMKCLETVTLGEDVKVKYFELDGCQIMERIAFSNQSLVKLSIIDCPKIEYLSEFRCLRYLESITVHTCGKFEFLYFIGCEKLQSIVLSTQVMSLSVESCRGLRRIAGTGYLTQMCISHCPELEELPTLYSQIYLEELKILHCEKLQSIVLSTQVTSLSIESCRGLRRIEGTGYLTKITNLYINDCQNLKSVSGIFELKELNVSDCPELEELPSLSRQSYLEEFVIDSCQKVKNIGGTEELHVLEYMQLSCLSRAAFRDCMAKLKSVPPWFVFAITEAVKRVEATSNQCQFSLHKIGVRRLSSITNESCVTVVNCFVVVISDHWSIRQVNDALSFDSRLQIHWFEGEWIITVVDRDDRSEEIKGDLAGLVKKWYRVFVKEGEEWKIRQMVPAIAELAMSGMESKLGEMFSELFE